ncbi:hypothetical protein AOC05_10625 [Arthrobacter alpinus]|uniref:Pilus assembly protein TadE n=1 Tax=Arthrobacter alpinus TaxID=656366 RepID=A0A0M3UG86_9MICC|nr:MULTISPECIES: hypothetical protein [Arthrobacter]ALE92655.1 hypothetical protein AOC05_10625 [Arthrobacter alpinus]
MRSFNGEYGRRRVKDCPATKWPTPDRAPTPERGSAVVEFVFLAVLLMVPVAYLILTVGALQGGAYAVVGAADQAARVYVLQGDEGTALQAARQAADIAVTDMGFDPAKSTLTITCDGGCLTPGATVTAQVRLRVDLPLVTGIPGVDLQAATVESVATQKVGRFK